MVAFRIIVQRRLACMESINLMYEQYGNILHKSHMFVRKYSKFPRPFSSQYKYASIFKITSSISPGELLARLEFLLFIYT